MNNMFYREMLEATRLTRAGQLGRATALLRRIFRGGGGSDAGGSPNSQGAAPAPTSDPLDPQSPSAGSAWNRIGIDWPSQQPLSEPTVPQALPGLLGRIGAGLRPLVGRPRPLPPDVVPPGGQFITGFYRNQAGILGYKLYIPSHYHGQPLPLLVMLHGCKQTADDFAAGTRMNGIAEDRRCFVVYPEQPLGANPAKCWNWFRQSDQRRDKGEPSLVAGITGKIMRDYCVDSRRVYVAGLSAGAAAAAVLGANYPDLYAAIGVHSGLACGAAHDLPSAYAVMREGEAAPGSRAHAPPGVDAQARIVPTIVFHGDRDGTVHPRNGTHVINYWTKGFNLRTSVHSGRVPGGHAYTRTVYRDATGKPLLERWDIHGSGHAWSGGSPAGTFTDPRGPDASQEMLRFFLEHPATR